MTDHECDDVIPGHHVIAVTLSISLMGCYESISHKVVIKAASTSTPAMSLVSETKFDKTKRPRDQQQAAEQMIY